VATDLLNNFRSGDTDNNVLRKILSRLLTVSDSASGDFVNPEFAASRTGTVGGKTAYVFHVLGRRTGFNSTSVLQDAAEFLGTSINAMPELTGAENLEVVSASTNDTEAGTGARTIQVTYIDTGGNLVTSADIPLNGQTAVALGFKSIQIIWMVVTKVGSGEVSAGNVLLRIAGAGATHEQITAGGNRSMSSHFMVPAGYTAYLAEWHGSAVGTATQDARLRATVLPVSRAISSTYLFQDTAFVAAGTEISSNCPYLACPALSKIKVSTIPSAAAAPNRLDSDYTVLLISNT